MKARNPLLSGLCLCLLCGVGFPVKSQAAISCGQTITETTTLTEDLVCPPDAQYALVIGASNITLDLGGHTLSGYTPNIGVFATGQEGIIIRNGSIAGFNDGIFIVDTHQALVENLTIKNLDISDPSHFIFGIHIQGSQNVVVQDTLFEFLSVPHKEAVEIYDSFADVRNIEVRGGGAGVSFSYAGGVCDPVNSPSNGTVVNSTFSNIYIAGIWISCSSTAVIQGNHFSPAPASGIGIQGDAPFLGAVTGLTIQDNYIHDTMIGIEFRGITKSSITNNFVYRNQIWGVALRQSLGCLTPEPGWECFDSTANVVIDNQTWRNTTDLYHYENSLGNTWEQNACQTKEGAEIPTCASPTAALTINYASGRPGSYFALEGANFPPTSTATILVNGFTLGTIPTDSSGDLLFLLNTEQADEGDYIVTATVNPSASAKFVLNSGRLLHQQAGQGTVFNVPAGLVPHIAYLPLVAR